jgi:hypothetical protein
MTGALATNGRGHAICSRFSRGGPRPAGLRLRGPLRQKREGAGERPVPALGPGCSRGVWMGLALTLALLLAPPLAAHPIHTSIAEADYNRTSQKLEVALRVFIDDFEAGLSAFAQKPVVLGRTPAAEFDGLARAYLAAKFTVRLPDGTLAGQVWVGREVKERDNELWLYFELPLPAGVEGCRVRHNLLGEQFPNQINSVRVRDANRRLTLVFLPKQTEKTVRFRPE